MERALQSDPDLAIGTARELIETICKTILKERGLETSDPADLPQLMKATARALLDLTRLCVHEHSRVKSAFSASLTARDLRAGFRRTLPTQKTDCRAFVQGVVVAARQSVLLILLVPSRA
jgi:hypothetical protein